MTETEYKLAKMRLKEFDLAMSKMDSFSGGKLKDTFIEASKIEIEKLRERIRAYENQ